ncbi:MAG: hypothetical protein R6T83_10880 [Salinibacter sp.]
MSRTALYLTTGIATGMIVGLMALAGAPTWALIGAAFGGSLLIWQYLAQTPLEESADRSH